MESSVRDRRIAAVIPLAALLAVLLSFWSLPFLALAWLLSRRKAPALVREVMLRVIDLFLSLLNLALAAGLVFAALDVVARDGEIERLALINRLLLSFLSVVLDIYGAVSLVFSSVRAWRGQLHDPKLSMGILQALRGRRQVAV
ncbi:hypothetical protein JVX91_14145 [Pseudomonas sp. PDNC002]|uniref:hypothetical protein n=1 Tax=Pseudomonas sp. PDNC002 TaxID=2811422 RepID=UPI001963BE7E|nr:hypothetical protein [Pseudomonas sp. PDNC002]QRY82184.1 hypothetical protein JVX91_14145 [Pseudomonas sp. PDNC002]